jgi:hypothetical protein
MSPDEIAHVCHEANRALQIEQADPTIPVSPLWEELDEQTRLSVCLGVEGVIDGNSPAESHAGWVDFKREHGWVWGPVKDLVAQEHPLLVPYDQLPEAQKLKDGLFAAIVHALK